MVKIYILFFLLSNFFSIGPLPFLASAQAQDNFDLNGVWERYDKGLINIEQTGSEVIATHDYTECPEGNPNNFDPYLEFKGTIDGNQIFGKESAWCYYYSPNPDENGLFFDPFQATISDDGNQLTLFSKDRFEGVEQSMSYSKISGSTGVEPSSTEDQIASTTDQLRDTFTSTLSQVEEPLTSLQENDLPRLLLLAGLGVAVIGGTAAYIKHRSSKKSQQDDGQANIEVVTRGGID